MLNRGAWKKMRRLTAGLPKGKQMTCACGGLLILEESATEIVLHHTMPACERYMAVFDTAEFTTLAAATEGERDAALANLTMPGGSPGN